MPIDRSPGFQPARWLRGAHRQTIWPALFRRVPAYARSRERLTLPDGDFLELDWYGGGDGVVLVLHGLTGSADSVYVRGLQAALAARGFRSAAMNFRGCSGVMNNSSRCYHSGETGDLNHVFHTLRARQPEAMISVVGFSLGGNVLLKWLGEQGGKVRLAGAVAVSVPMALDICATQMDQGLSRWYRDRLLKELKDYIQAKRLHLLHGGHLDEARRLQALGDLSQVRSFWDYDERVVAPLYGFSGAEDYYARSSSRGYLAQIRNPVLVIQALDDPFMTPEVIPDESELSPQVEIEVCGSGGHVGFVAGRVPEQPIYWLDERIPEFLATCVDGRLAPPSSETMDHEQIRPGF